MSNAYPAQEMSDRKEASLTEWFQVLWRKEGVNVKVPREGPLHLFFSISGHDSAGIW